MTTNNIKNYEDDVWADESRAARYYKLKPSTLRSNRSRYGHDKGLNWVKVGGKVLYNLEHNDRVLMGNGVK